MHALMLSMTKRRNKASFLTLIMMIIMVAVALNLYTNASGAYSKEINTIMIFPKDNSVWSQFHTAGHEIGHYIYFTKLTAEDRAEYEKLFNDSNEFVSQYSKTNAAENFAEEFSWVSLTQVHPEFVSDSRKDFFEKNWDKMVEGD